MDAFAAMNELAGTSGISRVGLGVAALVAGLASSVHCFAMCGPLACYGCSSAPARQSRTAAMVAYHLSRTVAYAFAGAMFGLAGGGLVHLTSTVPPRWIPWAMAAVLVATALGVGERVAALPVLAQGVRRFSRRAATLSPVMRSSAMGALTPLLPCGLLYGLFATSLLTASAGAGALLAGAFALGGTPALLLAQVQTAWMGRLPRGSDFVLRRVVPLVAAALLVYRALTPESCPLCR